MGKDVSNNLNKSEGKTIRELLLVLRNNLWLIIAIIALFIAGGIIFSVVQTPSYTASREVKLNCNVQGLEPGETGHTDATNAYANTIIDFCDEGVVIDLANKYYINYRNSNYTSAEDYIKDLKNNSQGSQSQATKAVEIVASNIKIEKLVTEEEVPMFFKISYVDKDAQDAQDKVMFLVYAFSEKVAEREENSDHSKYFGNINVYIEDFHSLGYVSNTSSGKNILIFGAIGVVVAVLVVYIKTASNKTINTKEDLEKIVGAPVFAALEK